MIQNEGSPYPSGQPLKQAKEKLPVQDPPRERYGIRGWDAEISSAVFSVLCVVAIAGLLSRVNGRLLSSWEMAISPNAVIAVMSTGAKVAMVFTVAQSISQLKWLYLRQGVAQ